MPSDNELAQHATSEHDFYALLDLAPGDSSQHSSAAIRRAYRRTALKHHPDKNGGSAAAVERFHLLQIAYEVLTDAGVRAAYDGARAARAAKARQKSLFDGKRRAMMDDLERRERGGQAGKRPRPEEELLDPEEALRREVARLAEDGRRRRLERQEEMRREQQDAEAEAEADRCSSSRRRRRTEAQEEKPMVGTETTRDLDPSGGEGSGVADIERTIKVRWAREGPGLALDGDELGVRFARFGVIERVFLLKDKKLRGGNPAETGGEEKKTKKKVVMATGVILFRSVVAAHAAVGHYAALALAPAGAPPPMDLAPFASVGWAAGRAPPGLDVDVDVHVDADVDMDRDVDVGIDSGNADRSTRVTPPATNGKTGQGSGAASTANANANANADVHVHGHVHVDAGSGVGMLMLEERTLLRLRMAGKRRAGEAAAKAAAAAAAAAAATTAAPGQDEVTVQEQAQVHAQAAP
ncbi:MAG: hypothetical protein M1826_005573 [Phylliscum demangeonii]|nr:MAG: hypothetical protein M1826_005573 [Phylliscum demangeonii]